MSRLRNTTIPAVFQSQASKYKDRACVMYKDTSSGRYVELSWNEMNRRVRHLAAYLMAEGVKKGDRVGLFSPNRPEWWIADLAICSIGAVNVPIYATNSAEECRYILARM